MIDQTGKRVYEHIIYVGLPQANVRVWCATSKLDSGVLNEQRAQIYRALAGVTVDDSWESIAELISRLPFCNAVEVTDPGGGGLIYPSWP